MGLKILQDNLPDQPNVQIFDPAIEKKQLVRDTTRPAMSNEVRDLNRTGFSGGSDYWEARKDGTAKHNWRRSPGRHGSGVSAYGAWPFKEPQPLWWRPLQG